jgi:hypothetical protein
VRGFRGPFFSNYLSAHHLVRAKASTPTWLQKMRNKVMKRCGQNALKEKASSSALAVCKKRPAPQKRNTQTGRSKRCKKVGNKRRNKPITSATWSVAVTRRILYWVAPNYVFCETPLVSPPVFLRTKTARHLFAAFFLFGYFKKLYDSIIALMLVAEYSFKVFMARGRCQQLS